MDLFKKPYEISLWDDRLMWHRRKLVSAGTVSKENYRPGKYYSANVEGAGAKIYSLDTTAWVKDRQYYELAELIEGNYLEGSSPEDIKITAENEANWRDANGDLVPQTISQFYKEVRLCVLGSDTMDSPARCVNPKLVSKINGENILTFTIYYRYWNNDIGDFDYNPFIKYLVNERKIKLRVGPAASSINDENCKWYDFVIKQTQENSETKAFTYTCKDQFVNELSKSGFNLVLDSELENNMGTIDYLAEKVLEDSDWRVGEGNDILKQYKEEPLYKIKVNRTLIARNMEVDETDENKTITISQNEYIYAFYSLINSKSSSLQFLYSKDMSFEIDDDLVILRDKYPNYILTGIEYNEDGWPDFTAKTSVNLYDAAISTEYRGERLVRQVQTRYDATIDKYVKIYRKDGIQYYGFTKSEYLSPSAVINYAANPDSFKNTTGWQTDKNNIEFDITTTPEFEPDNTISVYQTFLHYKNNKNAWVMNAGIGGNRSTIKQFVKGEKYIFRIKYKTDKNSESYATEAPSVKISFYEYDENKYFNLTRPIFTFGDFNGPSNTNAINAEGAYINEEGFITLKAECVESISKTMLIDVNTRIGLFINFPNLDGEVYVENIQVFPYVTYKDESGIFRMCVPGGKLFSDVVTKYIYYIPNPEYKSIDDLTPATESDSPGEGYEEVYNDGEFTKIRSITAKESNRFNLIQTLCETFECWSRFTINHNQMTGEILYGKDIGKKDGDEAYRQQKFVTFKENMGNNYNWAGFRYGINSKSITRSLDSNGIVSKLIVKDNANQFAPNGFCSIARATENQTKENFLLNFSYYTRHNLLNSATVTNDLHLESDGYIGYYKRLERLNADRERQIEIQSGLVNDISNFNAAYQTYKTSYDEAVEEEIVVRQNIKTLTGYTIEELSDTTSDTTEVQKVKTDWQNDKGFLKYKTSLAQLINIQVQHKPLYLTAKQNLDNAQAMYDEIQEYLEVLATQKRALNLQFYKKYSRFIQEGSWIKEDYVDDNLYYLDADSTLHTSAQPKVTYTINVLELSQLPGYENYKFELGEKSFVEDIEFFGYSLIDGTIPYKEEIVITELTQELDSPEKNSIKVQNYKTQFEDMFQRITATTQSVEYHTGEYAKAANVVQPNGLISLDTLQNSIANNAIRLENAKDQSVVWDEYGITTTSLSNPSQIVRIVSGGIFLSTDGGQSWKTGVTGSGISASYLTTGQINTDEIYIMNGGFPSFRWDNTGLSAYKFNVDENGNPYGFNNSKYVKFDQYGIYGINGNSEFNPNIEENGKVGEDKIWDEASFALTWKGFSLKNKDGSVRISSDNDIQVLENDLERIKIGHIDNNVYGIRISNSAGAPVMETDSKGTLWLREQLWVGTDNDNTTTVKIGYLDATRKYIDKDGNEIDTGFHEVIHASNNEDDQAFIVYEDGRMVAQGAEFKKGCKIGDLTIGEIEDGIDSARKLDIQSKLGYNFKVEDAMPNPSQLELEAMIFGFTMAENAKVTWYGSTDFSTWAPIITGLSGEANEKFVLTYEDFKNKQKESIYYLKAIARSEQGEDYENYATIMAIAASDLRLVITSSSGNYFKNGIGATVLTAKLFKGGQEIDAVNEEGVYEYTYTWTSDDAEWKEYGKSIFIEAKDVNSKRTYVCDISKGGN